jgi:ABC-type spermidine/putrescine transport system permease subunit I
MSRTRTLAVAAAGVALAAPLATATAGTHPTAQRTLLTLARAPTWTTSRSASARCWAAGRRRSGPW